VNGNLLGHYLDALVTIVEQVLRAEAWAQDQADDVRRYLPREINASEYWVSVAYRENAQTKLRTNLSEPSVTALQGSPACCVAGAHPRAVRG